MNEGILDTIGSAVGTAAKVGSGIVGALTSDKAQTIGGILGGKDGKLSTSLGAIRSAEENKIMKRKKCKNLKTIEIPRAQRELTKAQAAGNSDDVDYWTNEQQELEDEFSKLKCS
jgi:hypothetical protein